MYSFGEERNTCVLHPFNVTLDFRDLPDQLCALSLSTFERFDSFQGKANVASSSALSHLSCYQRDTEGEDEVLKKIPLERTPIFVSVVCLCVCDLKLPFLFLSDLQNWR